MGVLWIFAKSLFGCPAPCEHPCLRTSRCTIAAADTREGLGACGDRAEIPRWAPLRWEITQAAAGATAPGTDTQQRTRTTRAEIPPSAFPNSEAIPGPAPAQSVIREQQHDGKAQLFPCPLRHHPHGAEPQLFVLLWQRQSSSLHLGTCGIKSSLETCVCLSVSPHSGTLNDLR